MPTPTQLDIQGILPLFNYGPAATRAVNLGVGGPLGVGGAYPKGAMLGCPTSAAADEVITLNISGSPTGSKITITYTADKVYQAVTANAVGANHATVAQVQAVVDAIFGAGNVLVTGTPGTSFTLTFQGLLDNTRINGNFVASAVFTAGTTPAIAVVRTTRGSCGASQYELYDGSGGVCNEIDAVLKDDVTLDPTGARVTYPGRGAVGQAHQPSAYVTGFFDPANLKMFAAGAFTGIDANAYTLGKLLKKAGGTVARLL